MNYVTSRKIVALEDLKDRIEFAKKRYVEELLTTSENGDTLSEQEYSILFIELQNIYEKEEQDRLEEIENQRKSCRNEVLKEYAPLMERFFGNPNPFEPKS